MSAKTFYGPHIVACNDKLAINQLSILPSYVVVIDQSNANLQRLSSYPGFKPGVTNPGLPPIAKTQKVTPRFNPEVTLRSRVR